MAVTFVYLNRGDVMEPGHVAETIAVYLDVFGSEPYNESFTAEEVAGFLVGLLAKGNMILALLEGRVVGFIGGFELTSHSYCINEFAVRPTCQGHGIGTKLLGEMLLWTKSYSRLELRTSDRPTAARRMYYRFGFVDSNESEFVPQFRQNGRLELDHRVYMYNNFKLNRIVIAEMDGIGFAIIFDRDIGFDRKRLQAQIHKKWPGITHFCFVSSPSNPNAVARVDFFDESTLVDPIAWVLSSGRDYIANIELGSECEYTVQVDAGTIEIDGIRQTVDILHDGSMKLCRLL